MGERLELCIMMKNQLSGTGVFGTGKSVAIYVKNLQYLPIKT